MRHYQIKCNFGGIDDLCKLGREYYFCTDTQIMHFILDKILKLLTITHLLSLVVAKLPDLKNSPVFGPPCIVRF